MLPKNYSATRAARLERFKIPPITEPFHIEIPYLQSMSFESGRRLISKKPHRHSFFEASFVLFGKMVYSDALGQHILSEGDSIVFSPYAEHTVCTFSDDLVKLSLAFVPEKDSLVFSCLSEKSSFVTHFGNEQNYIFEDIFKEAENKTDLSLYVIRNRIFDILNHIVSLHGIPEKMGISEEEKNDTRIAFVKRYISDNKNIMLTCKDVAEQCHFSTKYLGRIFKEKTGMTLLEYIHSEKISQAQTYLKETNLTLTEISSVLGFANEYYFNSFFKRESGMTPGLYRNLMCKK